MTPVYETEKGIVRAAYTFIDHGLTEMSGEPRQNEEHQIEMDTHWLLNDNTTILAGSFNEEISVPRGDSTEASTQTTGGIFSFSRQRGFRDSYGFNYGVTHFIIDGEKTLSNSVGGQWSHSLNSRIKMTHTLQYSRSDLSTTSNAVGTSNSFAYETRRFIYDAILSASLNRGEDISEESISLAQNIQLAVKDGLASLGFTYTNPNLREGNSHQLLFTQAFSYPLTTVQRLSLNSSLAIVKSSLGSSLSGSLGVQYRRYFGPGVVSDPLWKKLIRGGTKSSVRGKVFWDKNQNFMLDEGDLPLKGVILGLDEGREAATDEKGSFVFSRVKAGEHRLSLEEATLKQAGVTEVVSVPDQTFTSDGREEMVFPIPVGSPSATLRVQFVLDTNENGQADDGDGSVALKTLLVTTHQVGTPEGEKRTVSVGGQGGTLVRGLTTGTVRLSLTAEDIPENVELIDSLEKDVLVTELTEYPVSFLFRPIRAIRGRIRMADNSSLPGGLTVRAGDFESTVDKKGYFWIKDIPPGHYEFQVRGIPSRYCPKGDIPREVEVPPGSFMLETEITLVSECTGT
ncbi:MAG: hypothetical protein HY541_03865 [Deltaproteobacteria bacterium]|nr:hypothetical protein [Deltaproteobacteria bacterium]